MNSLYIKKKEYICARLNDIDDFVAKVIINNRGREPH